MLAGAHKRELLTVQEVAAALAVHPATVRRRIAAGELRALRLGGKGSSIRIYERDLDAWLVATKETTT